MHNINKEHVTHIIVYVCETTVPNARMYMKYDNSLINYFNAYSYSIIIIIITIEAFIS